MQQDVGRWTLRRVRSVLGWRWRLATFRHILVPIDFSAPSDAALECARAVGMRFGASLHLLHVVEDPYRACYTAEVYVPDLEGLCEEKLSAALDRLNQRLTPQDVSDLHTTTDAVIGIPAWSIVEYAEGHDIDLIVIGTHGRGGVSHLLMGSVAEQVVRTAPSPVMTVRRTGTAATQDATPEAATDVPLELMATTTAGKQ